jgi:hypothetical protein
MEGPSRVRSAVKFLLWTIMSAALFVLVGYLHGSGKFAGWYYYQAAEEGYAVNADSFKFATRDHPAYLEIGAFDRLDGQRARAVKKGDRLPERANAVIPAKVISDGRRAAVEGGKLKVTTPGETKEKSGFKYLDTFKHKGIMTYPWIGVMNGALVLGLGLALGFMAEGFTDLLGFRVEKIRHFKS